MSKTKTMSKTKILKSDEKNDVYEGGKGVRNKSVLQV